MFKVTFPEYLEELIKFVATKLSVLTKTLKKNLIKGIDAWGFSPFSGQREKGLITPLFWQQQTLTTVDMIYPQEVSGVNSRGYL